MPCLAFVVYPEIVWYTVLRFGSTVTTVAGSVVYGGVKLSIKQDCRSLDASGQTEVPGSSIPVFLVTLVLIHSSSNQASPRASPVHTAAPVPSSIQIWIWLSVPTPFPLFVLFIAREVWKLLRSGQKHTSSSYVSNPNPMIGPEHHALSFSLSTV